MPVRSFCAALHDMPSAEARLYLVALASVGRGFLESFSNEKRRPKAAFRITRARLGVIRSVTAKDGHGTLMRWDHGYTLLPRRARWCGGEKIS